MRFERIGSAGGPPAQSMGMGAWSLAKVIHGLPFSVELLNLRHTESSPAL